MRTKNVSNTSQPFVDPVQEIARDFFAAESDEVIILDDYESDDLISTNDSETIDLGPAFTMNFDLGSELEGKGRLFYKFVSLSQTLIFNSLVDSSCQKPARLNGRRTNFLIEEMLRFPKSYRGP